MCICFDVSHNDILDINECLDGNNGGCMHNCFNVDGGRECTCNPGFTQIGVTACQG